jgi:hypothetical protein
MGRDLIAAESIAQSDIKSTGDDRVEPVLGMPVWHDFYTRRHLDPDQVRSGLRGLSNNHGHSRRRRKRRERIPVDLFRQDGSEIRLAWLLHARHLSSSASPLFATARGARNKED